MRIHAVAPNWNAACASACVLIAAAVGAGSFAFADAADVPRSIAGVEIPDTPLARRAESYVHGAEPPFLFNHSVRTYVFGALLMKAAGKSYDPTTAYVAALFHDAGLVPRFASPRGSFEVDGANAAEAFVLANGGSAEQARTVWNAVVMHDMGRAYQSHQSSEALLLGAGAASDVDGVDPARLSAAIVDEVLKAVPRLQFKKLFAAAASDHCRRKPSSQIGWLAALCHDVAPVPDEGSVLEEIAGSPFAE